MKIELNVKLHYWWIEQQGKRCQLMLRWKGKGPDGKETEFKEYHDFATPEEAVVKLNEALRSS